MLVTKKTAPIWGLLLDTAVPKGFYIGIGNLFGQDFVLMFSYERLQFAAFRFQLLDAGLWDTHSIIIVAEVNICGAIISIRFWPSG